MNRRMIGLVGAVSVATLSVAFVAFPEQPQVERTPDLAQGVLDLNRSVQEIAALLREQLKKQQADVLMKRMEISGRALSTQEQELRSAVAARSTITDALREIQARIEQLKDVVGREAPGGVRRPENELSREGSELDLREKLLKDRLAAAEQRVIELENDVAKRRDEIKLWEELVDAQLGLR